MKPVHVLLAVAVMFVWGLNFVVAKLGIQRFPPMFLIALRFTLVAALMVWFVRPPRERLWRVLGVSVTLGGLHFALMFTGLQRVDAGTAAIAIQLQVPFAALLAAIFFKDRFGWRRTLGTAVAFAGIGLIAGMPKVGENIGSLAMVIAAALVWATANAQIKALGEIDGFALNAWVAVFAAPQLFLASWLLESGQIAALRTADWIGWGAVVYMALVTTIGGYGFWYYLLGRYRMNQVMPLILLVPVFGVLSGVLFLDEALDWRILTGGALTVAGVGVIVLRRPRLVAPGAEGSAQ